MAKLDMAGKFVAESIMAKILIIRLRINVALVCFDVRSFGTELKSLLLFQCVHFSHHVWQPSVVHRFRFN